MNNLQSDNFTYQKILIIFIVLFVNIILISNCKNGEKITQEIKNGFIDISDWSFKENDAIKLKGNWKYKYNFEETNFLDIDFNDPTWEELSVPGYWNSKEKESYGYCVLRLKIKNNITEKLCIYIEYANTAYELYVNKDLYLRNGIASKESKKCIPQNIPLSVELPQTEYIDIVWFIANFHDIFGGPTNAPILNTVEKIEYSIWIQNLINSIVMGIILMISIYNIIFWIGRKKDKRNLFLSIFCFLIFLRMLAIFNVIETILPNISLFDSGKK